MNKQQIIAKLEELKSWDILEEGVKLGKREILDILEKWFESDQTSVCMICNQSWDGLVMVCENCGAKRIKDSYLNKIEWYIDYDDFKDKIKELRSSISKTK